MCVCVCVRGGGRGAFLEGACTACMHRYMHDNDKGPVRIMKECFFIKRRNSFLPDSHKSSRRGRRGKSAAAGGASSSLSVVSCVFTLCDPSVVKLVILVGGAGQGDPSVVK